MAVTRLQRKELLNKTRARVRVENLKINKSRLYIKSPYAAESGIILDHTDIEVITMTENPAETPPLMKAKKVTKKVISEMPAIEAETISESETSIPEEMPIVKPEGSGQDSVDIE
jgi:hypothetical protein